MKMLFKDLWRTIAHSFGRFLAIAGICALGIGFFGGLQMTCGSMKQELTQYFNDTNMMDIRIVCDMGISQENVDSFENIEDVSGVMPSCETDVLVNFRNDQCAVRVHSLPDNLDTNNENYINQQILARGNWPKNNDECVLSEDAVLSTPAQIGDEIQILECSTGMDDTLSVQKLKVVGFVHSSYYVQSVQMGPSVLGKGSVNDFAYVNSSFFKDSFPYSEVFITIKGAKNNITGTDAYQKKINEVMDKISLILPDQTEIREASIKKEAQKQIDEAKNQILDSEKLIKEKYELFNLYKANILGSIEDAYQLVQNQISEMNFIKDKCNINYQNLNTANNLVNNFDTVMDGLPKIIRELNMAIELNNSLANLTDDAEVKSQIEKLNYLTGIVLEVSNNFYAALQYSYTQETYNAIIDNYNLAYESLSSVLPARNIICDSVIDVCWQIINQQLPQQKELAISEFNNQELQLKDANAQLAEAKAKLQNSQADVDKLKANFYIMDRTKNFGAINFNNDAERIASIANVFPLMFFFVALLVVLTSMTRMIEEERVAIGTYKALGFSKLRISNKFVLYGVIASVTGSAIGLLVLTQFLPYVIMVAYSIIYALPINLPMPFDFKIACVSIAIGVGVTVLATLIAAGKTLRLQPARLLILTAPKAGKRILLEHIQPIWKLFNFNWKITFRNMFLYKKRLFMTLIGIAGCTALLLTGFGLHDSISDIMNKQFDEIAHDNFKVSFNDETSEGQQNEVQNIVENYQDDSITSLICEENVICMPQGHPNALTSIVVPKNIDQFQSLRVLRDRNTKESFKLDDKGVYISEKLANLMDVKAGDTLCVYNQDLIGNAGNDKYEFYIAGIVENYIAHYVYMTPEIYKHYFNKNCKFNNLIAHVDAKGLSQQTLIDNVKKNSTVKTAYFTTSTRQTYETMLKSVNMVVLVLIISAGLLAFVVLYNLININICERAREIATLKVLGSNKHEINMYIHRETFMLSIIGALLGLGLGFILEQFVIISAEVDMVMFGRNIYIWSYLISFAITMIFTVLVSLFMRKKLFTISMVESLKSVE